MANEDHTENHNQSKCREEVIVGCPASINTSVQALGLSSGNTGKRDKDLKVRGPAICCGIVLPRNDREATTPVKSQW